jgi:uncharacterized phage protein gp47/JayE
MPFTRPTLKEIVTRVETDIAGKVSAVPLLRRAFVKAIARAVAGAAHLLHLFLEWVARQLFPNTAEGAYLLRWAAIYGLSPLPAQYATGNVTATGVNGSVVSSGTQMKTKAGIVVTTTANATIASGTATIPVAAVVAGVGGNLGAGEPLALLSPVAGVNSTLNVASGGLTGGEDVEDLEELRVRLLERIQQPPHGGNYKDYIVWAKEVPGVTRAWVFPLYYGAGTVGVAFVLDDAVGSIIPDSTKVAEVQAYIDERRPVTAQVTVFAPTTKALNLSIALTPNTAAAKAAVTAEVTDLVRRESAPGGAYGETGTLLLSHIQEAISLAAGETDHVLTVPSADVTVTSGQIIIPGTITWL